MKRIILLLTVGTLTCAYAETNTYKGTDKDWDKPANWSLGHVPTAEDDVVVAAEVVKQGTNALLAASLTLNEGAKVSVGVDQKSDRWPEVTITGDLTLNGAATLTVYPGPTNATTRTFKTGGARVTVGGATTLNGTSQIIPYTHRLSTSKGTGAPVVFDLHALTVGASAAINSAGVGFSRESPAPVRYTDYGLRAGDYWGGSHGGQGGTIVNGKHLPAYDYLLAPILPGMGAGNTSIGTGDGGGVIRINATAVQIDGTLNVSGRAGGWSGGGAGGSIWITCESISLGANALLNAKGNCGTGYGYGCVCGTGAGGRIAIGVGLTTAQIDSLYETGTATGLGTNDFEKVFAGRCNLAYGQMRAETGWESTQGGVGTAVYVVNVGDKHSFVIENDSDVDVTASPAIGIAAYATGDSVSATVTSPALMRGKTNERRVCTAWEIRDDLTGEVLDSGEGTSVTGYTMPDKNVTLIWKWETVENQLAVGTHGHGSVDVTSDWKQPSADHVAVTATADAEYEFQYWTGDVEPALRKSNPLVISADRPRAVKAFFGKVAGETYTMAKSNNSSAFDWHDEANWTPTGIPGTNDTVSLVFTSGNRRNLQVTDYACVKALTVSGAYAFLRVGCKCSNYNSGDALRSMASHPPVTTTAYTGLDVLDDLTIGASGWLAVGGINTTYPVSLNVGGDLAIAGSLGVGAGSTNKVSASLYDPTGTVDVKGKMTVEATGRVYPCIHNATGGSVVFKAKTLEVEEGGIISAEALGYAQYSTTEYAYVFPWPTHYDNCRNVYHGGGHGGKGGVFKSRAGTVYGCKNAPIHAGMPGGNTGNRSGGVVRIEADNIKLNGKLTAHGRNQSGGCGGGSGGSVYVLANETLSFGVSAAVDVAGGDIYANDRGSGGGGRAAIGVRLTEEQKEGLLTSDDVEDVKISSLASVLTGFTAAGGSIGEYTNVGKGEDGTGVYLVNLAGEVPLNVVGDPSNFGDPTPGYGQSTYAGGKSVSVAVESSVFISGTDEKSRRVCGGFYVSNETYGVVHESKSNTGSFTMPKEESWLVWDWTRVEHTLTLSARAGGKIVTNQIDNAAGAWQEEGATISLTAVPEEGKVFAGWLGAVDNIDRLSPTISFPIEAGTALVACFASATGETKNFVGKSGAAWEDPASWSPEGMPGPKDNVVVNANDTKLIYVNTGFAIPLQSMSVANAAWLLCGNGKESAGDTVGFRIKGNLLHRGRMQLGSQFRTARPILEVGGDLTMDASSWNMLSLIAVRQENPELPESYRVGGGNLTVGGTLLIGSGATLRVICDPLNGTPIIIKTKVLDLRNGSAGGIIDAKGKTSSDSPLVSQQSKVSAGYYYVLTGSVKGFAPGSVREITEATKGNYHGASYGGHGAPDGLTSYKGTSTYGKDFAPYMPGSTGGNISGGGGSGGAVRLICHKAYVAGKILADAEAAGCTGGASGGGIWLTCGHAQFADTAVVSANGGTPNSWGAQGRTARSGGGGGGRVCITLHATDEQIAEMYTSETLPKGLRKYDLTDSAVKTALGLKGTFTANGGSSPNYDNKGEDGTVVMIRAPVGFMLLVR